MKSTRKRKKVCVNKGKLASPHAGRLFVMMENPLRNRYTYSNRLLEEVVNLGKTAKTNAMRLLDAQQIPYGMLSYEVKDGKIDGISVAGKIGKPLEAVYKTLVTQGHSGELYVFVIPVAAELDLKKAAKAAGEKKIEMVHVKDIQKYTGYIRGGCSPIGMKKHYVTFVDESAATLDEVIVSAGRIGTQIVLAPGDLLKAADANYADLIH
jgi:Cys-tRNA(Pro)/Cys-tRNA(Cys) deacylase